ncbi:hypothetical protein BGZ94_003781, partial [Podila epigama]
MGIFYLPGTSTAVGMGGIELKDFAHEDKDVADIETKRGCVVSLFVYKKYRGKGYLGRILSICEQMARDKGLKVLTIYGLSKAGGYEKFGYQTFKVEKRNYGDLVEGSSGVTIEDAEMRKSQVGQMVPTYDLGRTSNFSVFENGLEDTYCHQVIDALFTYQFPTRQRKYTVEWANGEAHGSKKRRGHGYKPDGVVLRNGKQISFLEVKPPGTSHTVKEYLRDYWNLANCAKDAIDDYLTQGLRINKVAASQ